MFGTKFAIFCEVRGCEGEIEDTTAAVYQDYPDTTQTGL